MSRKFNKTKFPGIYLLNTTNGDIVYYAFYRQEGKQICDKLGKRSEGWNLLKARDARIQRIAGCQETTVSRKRRQALENDEENSIPPLSELMELYFSQRTAERGKPLKTEIESRQRFQKHFSTHWSKTPSDIVELDLLRIRHSILKSGGKMATVSWLLGFYRTLIRFAVQAKLSPALEYQIPVPKASELKNRVTERLTKEELKRFLEVLDQQPPQLRNLYLFSLHTGVRRGEIFKLCWQDIDFEHRVVLLKDAKSGRDERIPLSKSAAEILMNQYSLRDQRSDEARERDLVFFTKTGKPWGKSRSVIWRLHREIRSKANLPEGFRMLHGLRHHFLTMHAVAGTPAPILMRLATHKDLATTQRYIDIADADLLAAADKTESLIQQQLRTLSS